MKRILVANRGEIARRIMSTCRKLNIESVGIYTDEEREYPHSFEGDQSFSLGAGPLSETYLNGKKIIEIALKSRADAIHPGYGFLSENAAFAQMVLAAGLVFIGPESESMRLMGDKKASKIKIEEIGVPSIPGYHGDDQGPEHLKKMAANIGYPVMIKASAGGGGKGMRAVMKEADFLDALGQAQREALNAFGNDMVLIEKFIQNPRHIEVQIFGDGKGKCVHLFERECSIQRRHQKIVEETPSMALDQKLRNKICQDAVKIAKAIDYLGAGTVEFILDDDGKYYFLEMNTRLQVEHPITEMITGFDLVQWQIYIAENGQLPVEQKDISARGHAIEVRIYFEDPDNHFLPAIGKLSFIGFPALPGARMDCAHIDGNTISINFDPLCAKMIVHGFDREDAIEKMIMALDATPFLGVKTNRQYLQRILGHSEFKKGQTFTHFVETHKHTLEKEELTVGQKSRAVAAALFRELSHRAPEFEANPSSPWQHLTNFRNT